MADTSIFFGVKQQTANSATTTVELEDDVYLYGVTVSYNTCTSTAIAFDSSNLDPEKTEQGSNWGYQILLRLTVSTFNGGIPTITFPNTVIWKQGIPPLINVPEHSTYYVRFEFVDGVVYGYYEGVTHTI